MNVKLQRNKTADKKMYTQMILGYILYNNIANKTKVKL